MRKTSQGWAILALLTLILIGSGLHWGGRQGLLVGFGVSLYVWIRVLFFGEAKILSSFGARDIEGQDPWGLRELLHQVASRLRVPIPRLVLFPSTTPAIFSVGRSWKSSVIAISDGALARLSEEELRIGLGLAMERVRRFDTFRSLVAQVLTQMFYEPAIWCDKVLTWAYLNLGLHRLPGPAWIGVLFLPLIYFFFPMPTFEDPEQVRRPIQFAMGVIAFLIYLYVTAGRWENLVDRKNKQVLLFQCLISPFVSLLIRLILSRPNVYESDRSVAQLFGSEEAVARLLWKLKSYSLTRRMGVHPTVSHLFIVNPLGFSDWRKYFHPLPDVDRRIQKLTGRFPL
ncbi:MAG: M48 family metalloprotease [Bdellovibrionales bacterium]|nr:M48 family metalloprotease [Bdellovibrionales bacterium]